MRNLLLQKLSEEGNWSQVFKLLGVNPDTVFQLREIQAPAMNSSWIEFGWLRKHLVTMSILETVLHLILICDRILFFLLCYKFFCSRKDLTN
uniref:Uncharacterized protein n=1 Tax=Glossina palpalis gambiensis TaxID=67801 RepID=A0A1B0C375_9MUSC